MKIDTEFGFENMFFNFQELVSKRLSRLLNEPRRSSPCTNFLKPLSCFVFSFHNPTSSSYTHSLHPSFFHISNRSPVLFPFTTNHPFHAAAAAASPAIGLQAIVPARSALVLFGFEMLTFEEIRSFCKVHQFYGRSRQSAGCTQGPRGGEA